MVCSAALDQGLGGMAGAGSTAARRSSRTANRARCRDVGFDPAVRLLSGSRQEGVAAGFVAKSRVIRDAEPATLPSAMGQGRSGKRAAALVAVRLGALAGPAVRFPGSAFSLGAGV